MIVNGITKKHIREVVAKGNWMIRADNNGISASPSAKGFRWKENGEWTIAPDWNLLNQCGGGLHGQDKNWGGCILGSRLVFCETSGKKILLNDKIKVRRARILMIEELPKILFMRNLNLSGCTLPEGLKLPESVGGSLDLRGCTLPEGLKLPEKIKIIK